jgi:predicted nucleotidyltransferase
MLPLYQTIVDVIADRNPRLSLVIVFGSVAAGTQTPESDLDIAIDIERPLTADEKALLISDLAEKTGRPIDLIDLKRVGEPLLGQILRHGTRIFGTETTWARLLVKHLFDTADFLPYRDRILKERREAWIGK